MLVARHAVADDFSTDTHDVVGLGNVRGLEFINIRVSEFSFVRVPEFIITRVSEFSFVRGLELRFSKDDTPGQRALQQARERS